MFCFSFVDAFVFVCVCVDYQTYCRILKQQTALVCMRVLRVCVCVCVSTA